LAARPPPLLVLARHRSRPLQFPPAGAPRSRSAAPILVRRRVVAAQAAAESQPRHVWQVQRRRPSGKEILRSLSSSAPIAGSTQSWSYRCGQMRMGITAAFSTSVLRIWWEEAYLAELDTLQSKAVQKMKNKTVMKSDVKDESEQNAKLKKAERTEKCCHYEHDMVVLVDLAKQITQMLKCILFVCLGILVCNVY
ncbi:hypothetical protein U9M48_028863, partial [Paspalum notatum var. saurae]